MLFWFVKIYVAKKIHIKFQKRKLKKKKFLDRKFATNYGRHKRKKRDDRAFRRKLEK